MQGAATTEHCQNTALRVWEIPGKNPIWRQGGFKTGHETFFRIICEQQRLKRWNAEENWKIERKTRIIAKFYEFVEENNVIRLHTLKSVVCLLIGEFQIPFGSAEINVWIINCRTRVSYEPPSANPGCRSIVGITPSIPNDGMDVLLSYLLWVVSVQLSATSWSLVRRNPTGCMCVWLIVCDLQTLITRNYGRELDYWDTKRRVGWGGESSLVE
jgi:hypothetical protein